MNINERIEKGRCCAYGIDQSVDLEKAYQMWCGLENILSSEDIKTYEYVKDALGIVNNYGFDNITCVPASLHTLNVSSVGDLSRNYYEIATGNSRKKHTVQETRELFEEILTMANSESGVDSLYSALERYKRSHSGTREKNPEHIRLGNNIGYLIFYFWTSIDNFFYQMNEYRKKKGLDEKKSIQGLYQVIGGKNGMDNSGKIIITEMANKLSSQRGGLKRPLQIQDLSLSIGEFITLFSPPKLDEKTKRLLSVS